MTICENALPAYFINWTDHLNYRVELDRMHEKNEVGRLKVPNTSGSAKLQKFVTTVIDYCLL